jgi:outer membrane protein assembly factor BamB
MNSSLSARLRSMSLAGVVLATASFTTQAQHATTYQIDRGHTGATTLATPLTLPLSRHWHVTLPGALSYPLIAGGDVYVLSQGAGAAHGTRLFALDALTGAKRWSRLAPDTFSDWGGHSYGDGRVYVLNGSGVLKAFDANTGAEIWSTSLSGEMYSANAAPTFSNGMVYVGTDNFLRAIDAATGTLRWAAFVWGAGTSSPAVSDAAVYGSYNCGNDYAFDALTGSQLWMHVGDCQGAAGVTPVLAPEIGLLARDPGGSNIIIDAATGAKLKRFTAGFAPAVAGRTMYAVTNGKLVATDFASQQVIWSYLPHQTLIANAPILVNHEVFVGTSDGHVIALDAATGAVDWRASVGTPILSVDERNALRPMNGLAAGEGLVVVPAGSTLTAFGN